MEKELMKLSDYHAFPADLPIIVEDNLFLYPFMISPLFLSDEENIRAANDALNHNSLVLVATSKAGIEHGRDFNAIYDAGVIGSIMRKVDLPDGRVKILFQGIQKGKIVKELSTVPLRGTIDVIGTIQSEVLKVEAMMAVLREKITTLSTLGNQFPPDLLKTIEEVELTANKKFLDTFHLVRENFQKVFKTLFTEDDQCDLVLENPENIAETGIDVIAKPKGKRPSSLTQLSGGERTLTATALLFAIYLIKPAPFCILDEVDAPLDDANVSKFTNMIRQFSDNSQFIIVTHNKMTMSTVDVIYGVTMQEPGVSKLVPVDFRNLEKQN